MKVLLGSNSGEASVGSEFTVVEGRGAIGLFKQPFPELGFPTYVSTSVSDSWGGDSIGAVRSADGREGKNLPANEDPEKKSLAKRREPAVPVECGNMALPGCGITIRELRPEDYRRVKVRQCPLLGPVMPIIRLLKVENRRATRRRGSSRRRCDAIPFSDVNFRRTSDHTNCLIAIARLAAKLALTRNANTVPARITHS
jgi:hypothetical protein